MKHGMSPQADRYYAFMVWPWVLIPGGASLGIAALFLRDYVRKNGIPKAFWILLTFATVCGIVCSGAFAVRSARGIPTYRHRVRANIKIVSIALEAYAFDHGGAFPAGGATQRDSLWMLYPKYVTDPQRFLDERGLKSPPTVPALTSTGTIDPTWLTATGFTYLEGHDNREKDIILLFEISGRDGRKLVKRSGDVEEVPAADLAKALHTQLSK